MISEECKVVDGPEGKKENEEVAVKERDAKIMRWGRGRENGRRGREGHREREVETL